jgi:hypothetical protein
MHRFGLLVNAQVTYSIRLPAPGPDGYGSSSDEGHVLDVVAVAVDPNAVGEGAEIRDVIGRQRQGRGVRVLVDALDAAGSRDGDDRRVPGK